MQPNYRLRRYSVKYWLTDERGKTAWDLPNIMEVDSFSAEGAQNRARILGARFTQVFNIAEIPKE